MAGLTKKESRQRRHRRLRRNLAGTAECPRLTVFISDRHIRAQVIDDVGGRTLASASTDEKDNRSAGISATVAGAAEIGRQVADRAKSASIESVVFDRSGFKYHGIVKALAESARENGLTF